MTVLTQTSKVIANGNGAATSFSFSPIVIFESGDLVVTKTDTAGVETVLTEGAGAANYTVVVSAYPGTGSVTYPSTGATRLETGEKLTMKRLLDLTQETDLENQGGYFPEVQETQLDKLVMIDIQQQEEVNRAIKFPVSYNGAIGAATNAPTEGYFLRAGATGLEFTSIAVTTANAGNTTPANVSLSAGAAGAAANFAREDHVHKLNVSADVVLLLGTANDAAFRTELGLGDAATKTVGTSSGNVPASETVFGKQTIWVPAAAMTSRSTNGAAVGTTEMSTNKNMIRSLDFDTTTQEFAQFQVAFPKSWDEGTVTFEALWTAASGSGGVAFTLAGVATSDDDALDVAFGTAQTVTDTLITANDCHRTSESSAITIAGTPAAGDLVTFQIARDPANGSDTLGVDAKLLGIRLYFTTDTGVDS